MPLFSDTSELNELFFPLAGVSKSSKSSQLSTGKLRDTSRAVKLNELLLQDRLSDLAGAGADLISETTEGVWDAGEAISAGLMVSDLHFELTK